MTDAQPTGALLVATPAASDPVNALSQDEAAHVSLLWFGERAELDPETEAGIRAHVQQVVMDRGEFTADVSGQAVLGSQKAGVLLIESIELMELRTDLFDDPYVQQAWLAADQFPAFIPHLTLNYGGGLPSGDLPEQIHFDGVGLWLAGQHEPYSLRTSASPMDDPNFYGTLGLDIGTTAAVIPPVLDADDLPMCVQFAQDHPHARWYAEKRAAALGLTQLIPQQWAVPA